MARREVCPSGELRHGRHSLKGGRGAGNTVGTGLLRAGLHSPEAAPVVPCQPAQGTHSDSSSAALPVGLLSWLMVHLHSAAPLLALPSPSERLLVWMDLWYVASIRPLVIDSVVQELPNLFLRPVPAP